MKVFYSEKWDAYFPSREWDGDAGRTKEMEVTKEELISEGGDDEPSRHGERWEMEFTDDDWMHSIGTKIPWKPGKYKITIEEVKEE